MALNHENFYYENSCIHKLIYEMNFFFLMWGDDAVQACTSNLAIFSYYFDAYLLITARIAVHDS